MDLFAPGGESTVLAVTSATGRIQLPAGSQGSVLRFFNDSTSTIFAQLGGATVNAVVPVGATLGGFPIPPGLSGIRAGGGPTGGQTHIAGIVASGTANLYITMGSGI